MPISVHEKTNQSIRKTTNKTAYLGEEGSYFDNLLSATFSEVI